MSRYIFRGDIYITKLNPAIGHEQGGIRPVLVIQNDVGNQHSPTIIVAPLTSRIKKTNLPTHVCISDREKLEKNSIVLLEQIRTLDKSRLGDFLGKLNDVEMAAVNKAISISLGV